MPGPLKKTTANETLVIPVLENAPELRVRPPASNTTDTTTNAPPADDGLFIRNGGMDRDKL